MAQVPRHLRPIRRYDPQHRGQLRRIGRDPSTRSGGWRGMSRKGCLVSRRDRLARSWRDRLYTAGQPDPGSDPVSERRAAALSILHLAVRLCGIRFQDILWPDYTPAALDEAPCGNTPSGTAASAGSGGSPSRKGRWMRQRERCLKGLMYLKSRILTGIVGAALALVVLLLLPRWFSISLWPVICAIAMCEVFVVTKMVNHPGSKPRRCFCTAGAFLVMLRSMPSAMGGIGFRCFAGGHSGAVSRHAPRWNGLRSFFLLSVLVSISFSCLAYLRTTSHRDERDGLFLRLPRPDHPLDVGHWCLFYRHVFRPA